LQLTACLQLLTGKLNQISVLTEAINKDIQFLAEKPNEEVHFEKKRKRQQ
jgi:predicted nucleic acid-binding Zn ribbon protein